MPYGGFSSPSMERTKAAELIKKLEAAKEPFSTQHWYTAGYDSPYQLINRHNEVWIPRTAGAATSSTAGSSTAAEAGKKAASGH